MTDLNKIFLAGLTQRWHTNPWLAHTNDRNDGHQGRVARILIALWPDASRDLIVAALTHDDGESVTGDIPAPAGKTVQQEQAEARARNGVWGSEWPKLSAIDVRRLNLCDKLDAYLWMLHWAPRCGGDQDWLDAATFIGRESEQLSVSEEVCDAVRL